MCERGFGLQAFQKHVAKVHASATFKEAARQAQPFFNALKDFAFGRDLSLENAYNVCLVETPAILCSLLTRAQFE